jgi:hypothetical protein
MNFYSESNQALACLLFLQLVWVRIVLVSQSGAILFSWRQSDAHRPDALFYTGSKEG